MPENRPRILVVDDREQNRYVLCRILRQAQYDCSEAASGTEALARARDLPDVIILDVSLPDMSGYEVCRRLKQDPQTAQISILQISANMVSNEHKAQALEAGADGYLIHPIDGTVLVATVRSLLRLRAAEAAARRSATQWQSTFDALQEGLAFVGGDGRLVHWNRAFERICGPIIDLAAGLPASALVKQLTGAGAPVIPAETERYRAEFTLRERTYELAVNRTRDGAIDHGAVLVLIDITDRQLAEYALRTAEKIAATSKLANAIAHEINNPLESLMNLTFLARNAESLETAQEYLAQSGLELERIARIARQTLAFHRDTLRPVMIDIGSLINDVVALFEKSAATRRVRLLCDSRPARAVHGFPGQLSQVFGNLIRNGIDAAQPDSEVTVRLRTVHRAAGEGVRITIHDSGTGIPKNVQEKMFDPFFTTKELRGSGLGLWVSRNLIMNHHGTIRFRSSTRAGASGTMFEVFLPVEGGAPKGWQQESA